MHRPHRAMLGLKQSRHGINPLLPSPRGPQNAGSGVALLPHTTNQNTCRSTCDCVLKACSYLKTNTSSHTHPPKRILTSTTSNRSFLINVHQAVSGACRVRPCSVSVCWFQPNRGIRREAVLGKTAVHRSRGRREEQDTDYGCMCVGTHRKYRRKVQKTQRDLFGKPA